MRLIIEIEMENAAFEYDPGAEVVRILRTVPQKVDWRGENSTKLRDINGNHVGFAKVGD